MVSVYARLQESRRNICVFKECVVNSLLKFPLFCPCFGVRLNDLTNELCRAPWGAKLTIPRLPSARARTHERTVSPVAVRSWP